LDLLAFTGGIGEHDAALRLAACEQLQYLGVRIDEGRNKAADGSQIMAIHADDSSVEIWVVPTDEGRVAAGDAAALIAR
jgi:acetate kinase